MTESSPRNNIQLIARSLPLETAPANSFNFQLKELMQLSSSVQYSCSIRWLELKFSVLNLLKAKHHFRVTPDDGQTFYDVNLNDNYFCNSFQSLLDKFTVVTPDPAQPLFAIMFDELRNKFFIELHGEHTFMVLSSELSLMLGFGSNFVLNKVRNFATYDFDPFYDLHSVYLVCSDLVESKPDFPSILRILAVDTELLKKTQYLSYSFEDSFFVRMYANILTNFEISLINTRHQPILVAQDASLCHCLHVQQRFLI